MKLTDCSLKVTTLNVMLDVDVTGVIVKGSNR